MPTDAQNAYMADTFGVDPAAYPAGTGSSGDAPASGDDTAGQTTQPADDVAPPAQTADATAPAQPTAAAPDDAAADTSATAPAGATASTDAAAQDPDAAAEKPTLSVKSNGDGTFTLSGSGFVGNIAYIRAVGTGAKDYAYGQAWGSVPVSGGSFSATTPDVCGAEGGDRFFSANDGRPDANDKTGTLWSNTVKVSCPNAGGGGGDDPGDDPGADPVDPGAGDKGDGTGGGDAAASGDQGAAAGAGDATAGAASPPDGATASDTSAVMPAGATASTDAATQDTDAAAEKPTLSVKTNGDGTFTLSGSGFVGNIAYIRAVGTGAKDYAYGQAWGSVPVSGGSFSATTPDVCGTEGGDRFFSANDGRPDANDKTGTLWSNTVKVSCPNAGGGGGDDPGDDPGTDPGSDPGTDPGAAPGDRGASGSSDNAGAGDQTAGANAPASSTDPGTPTGAIMPTGETAASGVQDEAASQPVAATGPLTPPPVPQIADSIAEQLRQAVQQFLVSFTRVPPPSVEWSVSYGGKTATISEDDRNKLFDQLGKKFGETMEQGFSRVSDAEGLYAEQKKVDDKWWLTSHVVHFFGNVDDPGPALKDACARAKSHHAAAQTAIASRDLENAAIEVADCLGASKEAELLAQGYFEGTIGAAEFQVTVLEGVVTASKYTLLVLSIAATGGASGAMAGAIAGVANTTMDTINDASMGKPVDWTTVTVSLIMELVMYRFGAGLEKALEEEVAARLAKEGAKYSKAIISKACTEVMKVAMSKAASAALKTLQGKEVTGEDLAKEAFKDITSPGSLATEVLKAIKEVATG